MLTLSYKEECKMWINARNNNIRLQERAYYMHANNCVYIHMWFFGIENLYF